MQSFLAAVVLIAFPSLQAQEPKGDLAKLQGRWTRVEAKDAPSLTWVIKGSDLTGRTKTSKGVDATITCTLKLDEAAKPRVMDSVKIKVDFGGEVGVLEGEVGVLDYPDEPGIYECEGDTLKVCSGLMGHPRPKTFETSDTQTLTVFRREKDEPKK